MKKHILAAATAAAAIFTASAAVDPAAVLMTVDGKNVTVAEFEYLLNKNKSQQAELQSVDDYLRLFVDFKLKVADAERAGMQNDSAFVREFTQYRDELAEPYMISREAEDSLVQRAYSHYGTDVAVSHIMLPRTDAGLKKAEELRAAIESGSISFEEAARNNSVDRPSAALGGRMGNVVPGRFPWAFEDAAYSTAPGKLSEVVNSGFGYHIIRTESVKPSEGEVHAAHILRMTMNKSEEEATAQKAKIDSIYTLLKDGAADFAALARQYSEDGSAQKGGDLGWFGRGMMVEPFDSISFALADGAISEPFATRFGYHIIRRFEHRGTPSLDVLRSTIEAAISRDERADIPAQVKMAEFRSLYGELSDEELKEKARADLEKNNPDYRNLVHEYRDGILLFNIANEKVWGRAAADTLGLEAFFRENAAKYAWNEPKFKGYVIMATSDSTLADAVKYAATFNSASPSDFSRVMREKFGRDIKIERVIASKGENAIIDHIAFGAPEPAKKSKWSSYAAFDSRIITNPEEAADVRNAVVTDYQAKLEADWLSDLHKKYKVKVNNKLFKKLKNGN